MNNTEGKPNPTLVPRRAYSQDVVGKWTQIVRQSHVKEDGEQEHPEDPKIKALTLLLQKKKAQERMQQQQALIEQQNKLASMNEGHMILITE